MRKFLVIASFLFTIFYAEKTYACTCMNPDPNKDLEKQVEGAYQDSFAVFSAKVLTIQKSGRWDNKVKLSLNKSWKGKLAKTLTITTASSGSMCGYSFEKGKIYLIYAYGKNGKDLFTTICTRTNEINLTKDAAVLDGMKKN